MTTATAAKPTPLEIRLFSQQADFVEDRTAHVACVTGVGGGKTRAGAVKSLIYASEYPGSAGMVTAPTFPMLRDATLKTIREVWPPGFYVFNEGRMTLACRNGSLVLLRSTDDPEHLRGPNLAWVWMDEAAQSPGEAFKILQGRVRQPGYPLQLWASTTPKGFNWVYEEFAKQVREGYRLYTWPTSSNPYLPPDYVEKLRASYDPAFALQEIEGQFVLVGDRPYFEVGALQAMLDDVRPPMEVRRGLVSIWRLPMVARRYVAGGDLAWGDKGAYSCLVLMDWQTGEMVAEVHGRPKAGEMAQVVVDLCREYNNAFAVVERNGEGVNVVNLMVELGYGAHMFYQDHEAKAPKTPGWLTGQVNRDVLLGEFAEAVAGRAVRVPCRDALYEMMRFVRDEKGHPGPASGTYSDHVMALALAWQGRGYARWGAMPGARLPAPVYLW